MYVTFGCHHIVPFLRAVQHRDIKCSSSEIEYDDLAILLAVITVCHGSSCRLVEYSLHLQTCHFASVNGCLTLFLIKIGRYSDDCPVDGLTEVTLSVSLQ